MESCIVNSSEERRACSVRVHRFRSVVAAGHSNPSKSEIADRFASYGEARWSGRFHPCAISSGADMN
jgi:hypothetical protein